jgi:hypothetical protein
MPGRTPIPPSADCPPAPDFIAFEGSGFLARGSLAEVALQVKLALQARPLARFLVFNASSSETIDIDLRGSAEEVLARLSAVLPEPEVAPDLGRPTDEAAAARSGPGRPRLGVVAREVTLLPRHWAWLGSQPGGASVALRKLVEQASRASQGQDRRRQAQEATYRFMSVMAGSLPGFEEAARALFAADRLRWQGLIALWPKDIQSHLQQLAPAAMTPPDDLNEPEFPHAR